jgi:hypothetical protein
MTISTAVQLRAANPHAYPRNRNTRLDVKGQRAYSPDDRYDMRIIDAPSCMHICLALTKRVKKQSSSLITTSSVPKYKMF